MQPVLRTSLAPSSSLLRFLRLQAKALCFFTGNPPPSSSPASPSNVSCSSWRTPALARSLTTTRSHQANVDLCHYAFESLESRTAATHESSILGGFTRSRSYQTKPHRDWHTQQGATASQHLLKRLWKHRGGRKGDIDGEAGHLPPLPTFLDDAAGTSLGRNKGGKPGSELKLRCTEVDENGNVITVNGEFKKSELIAKVHPEYWLL